MMTVIFTNAGGVFFPDDTNRQNPDDWKFMRKDSKQLCQLMNVIGKPMSHSDLLRAMSSIRFSVENFGEIFGAMRRVRIDKKVAITSSPRIEDGKSGADISFQFQIEGENGGVAKAKFPAEFICKMPLISMASKEYSFLVEVDSWLEDKALLFALRMPGLEAIRTQAILDEITTFKAAAKKQLPDLLVVTDL